MTTSGSESALREHGFAVVPAAMTPHELESIRRHVDDLLTRTPRENECAYFANVLNVGEVGNALAAHPLIVSLVERLLGTDCLLNASCLRATYPGCVAQTLHRDQDVFWPSMPWMNDSVALNTMWALDELTSENTLRVVPGSHRTQRCDGVDVPVICPAGACVVFDLRLVHRGGANTSQSARRALFVSYVRSFVKPLFDNKRSVERRVVDAASPTLLRLLGFERQSSVERDGRSLVVEAPGATNAFGLPPDGFIP